MPTRQAAPADRAPRRPWYRRWWAGLLVLPGLVLAVVLLLGWYVISTAVPLPEDIGAAPTTVYDVNGEPIGTLSPQAARRDVPLEELPRYVADAVMAAEDRAFETHRGISPTGVVRALFTNAQAGEIRQGGSTITQQYVKNAHVGSERTFDRKAREAALAIKLEQTYEKPAILEMYLNTIYWGRGAYGIEAAARTYFDVGARELDLNQAALLAGIIRSPEHLDPLEAPEAADVRRVQVLDAMLAEGWIDRVTRDRAADAGLPTVTARSTVAHGRGAYYLDAVRRELAATIGEDQIYRGLEVHTAMDLSMQAAAEDTLAAALDGATFTGAIVSVDPRTGGVRALVGGPDLSAQPFNAALLAARQVGSAFKPFTLAAFVAAGHSPASVFDAPACLPVEGVEDAEVCNHEDEDLGELDLYAATARSANTVYTQVQEEVGAERVIDLAAALGLPRERGGEVVMEPYPTLTLGVDEFTPIEMAGAYGAWAAGGVRLRTHLVERVVGPAGDVLHAVEQRQREATTPNDAAIVTDVLRGVIEGGTGTAAVIGRPAAGKTGTTDDSTDAWFVGYVPQLSTAVWFGHLEGTTPLPDGMTGSGLPAVTWGRYMDRALATLPVEDFPAPDLSEKRLLGGQPTAPDSRSPATSSGP